MRWHHNKHDDTKIVAGKNGRGSGREGDRDPGQDAEAFWEGEDADPEAAGHVCIFCDALIRKVPRGKLVTQAELREKLARAAGADVACPITTGIFVRIVAEAAAEDMRAGKARVTPYWRVVRDDGRLLEKLPGGPLGQAERLEAEGHRIDSSGKLRVLNGL
jgi:alkylated DNA nucleotide flippase Atl1